MVLWSALARYEESGGLSWLTRLHTLPWKKWLLWSLLVLAALITARMAFKLYREMNSTQSA